MLANDPVIGAATAGSTIGVDHRIYTGGIPEGGLVDPATGAMGPSIAVVEVAANPTFTTTDGYMDRETIQVSVFAGNDPDTARTLGKRARTLLSPHRNYVLLSFADGIEAMRIPGMNRLQKDPDKGVGGVDVFQMIVEATFLVNRSLS